LFFVCFHKNTVFTVQEHTQITLSPQERFELTKKLSNITNEVVTLNYTDPSGNEIVDHLAKLSPSQLSDVVNLMVGDKAMLSDGMTSSEIIEKLKTVMDTRNEYLAKKLNEAVAQLHEIDINTSESLVGVVKTLDNVLRETNSWNIAQLPVTHL
ncbi:unnamed protein product, partial [Cylicostephanus goldi]